MIVLFLQTTAVAAPPSQVTSCAEGDASACENVLVREATQLAALSAVGEEPAPWQWSLLESSMLQLTSLKASPEQQKRMQCRSPAPACVGKSFQHADDFHELAAIKLANVNTSSTDPRRQEVIAAWTEAGRLSRWRVVARDGEPSAWTLMRLYAPSGERSSFSFTDDKGTLLVPIDENGEARLKAWDGGASTPAPSTGPMTMPFVPRLHLTEVQGTVAQQWVSEGHTFDLGKQLERGTARELSQRVVAGESTILVFVDDTLLVELGLNHHVRHYSPAAAESH